MASYNGLIGDKYGLPQTAVILVAFEHPEMIKNTLQRMLEDQILQKFEGLEKYLFLGLQRNIANSWDTKWIDLKGNKASVFSFSQLNSLILV